ncbi:MAG: hypothetical protein JXA33_26790 [Anaerolineae bacterium]|nr:hypothetical protein [Anaerolineae bacterium]
MDTIYIKPTDDRYTVREALRHTTDTQILIVLPWDAGQGWNRSLNYDLLLREAQVRNLEVVWVIEDPQYRSLARESGFPVFHSIEAVQAHVDTHETLPSIRQQHLPKRPLRPLWAEAPRAPQPPIQRRQPLWLILVELVFFFAIVFVVGGTLLLTWPSAHIVLVPNGVIYQRVVPVSVDPTLETVDLQRGLIPSKRIGDEFESYAEVQTTGRGFSFTGHATGWVLFTNLLGQDYQVPENTIVRTTAGSYPVRYQTTVDVTVPAFGSKDAPVEALEEGPQGNVEAYQINLVEGVAGFALRVTNPYPIAGAESATVATVSEEDRDRAWDIAAQKVLVEAYNGLQSDAYLEPGEFLPRQTMVIQSVPKAAYTNLIGEESDTLGITLRLLVTGQKVKAVDVQAIAYRQLALQIPEGYSLTDTRFEYGESAEEDIGPGIFTFFVNAYGYASAQIDDEEVISMLQGKPLEEATALLEETFPLARPPEIAITPEWFPYIPFLTVRTEVEIVPGKGW